jgi:hypothetical protein
MDRPIGLLTHHLVQDEPAWAFLEAFLRFSRTRFAWRSFEQLAAWAEAAGGPLQNQG